jgi:hypothetical protein
MPHSVMTSNATTNGDKQPKTEGLLLTVLRRKAQQSRSLANLRSFLADIP